MKTRTDAANEVFRNRLKQWQGSRTQVEAARILGIKVRAYRNYVWGERRVPMKIILFLEGNHAGILPESTLPEQAETGQ